VAQLIRSAVKKCVENAEGLLAREDAAIEAVFEGLVIGGIAMAYAGVSRPASGVEHYFSHVWDMRGLEFGTQVDLHGIQCAMATMKAVELYEKVMEVKPDYAKAKAYVDAFRLEAWNDRLRTFLGSSAETMIELERKEGKYRKDTHAARFALIEENWEKILTILRQELPAKEDLQNLLDMVGISRDLTSIGVDRACAQETFRATKDIRDKYVLSRLAWDLGILEELCETL
jgi:glycerol-1-phosphate dehydrogenase [NAD(P)+]